MEMSHLRKNYMHDMPAGYWIVDISLNFKFETGELHVVVVRSAKKK